MAVVNKKSTQITAADASPPATTTSYIHGGRVKESVGFFSVAAADDDGSTFRVVRLPSNARISAVLLKHDTITLGSDYDIGFYDTPDNGSAVISVDALVNGATLVAARAQYTDLSTIAELDAEKQLWELAGLTEDPIKEFDVVITGNTVGTSAGDIACLVQYVL